MTKKQWEAPKLIKLALRSTASTGFTDVKEGTFTTTSTYFYTTPLTFSGYSKTKKSFTKLKIVS